MVRRMFSLVYLLGLEWMHRLDSVERCGVVLCLYVSVGLVSRGELGKYIVGEMSSAGYVCLFRVIKRGPFTSLLLEHIPAVFVEW